MCNDGHNSHVVPENYHLLLGLGRFMFGIRLVSYFVQLIEQFFDCINFRTLFAQPVSR